MREEILLPDTDGKWHTFAFCPVSLQTHVYIAFDGEITSREIKRAMQILELALDWAAPGVRIESAPTENGILTPAILAAIQESDNSRLLDNTDAVAADQPAAESGDGA